MSGHKANIRQRVGYKIDRPNQDEEAGRPIRLEVKSGDPTSGLPVAVVELGDDWTLVPLIDRVVSIRRSQ